MNKTGTFMTLVIVAGLGVSLAALAGYPRVAMIGFICSILVGATFLLWPMRQSQIETSQGSRNKKRTYFWLGVILIVGASIQLLVKCAEALSYRVQVGAGPIIEFAVSALLAVFLFSLSRRKTDPKER